VLFDEPQQGREKIQMTAMMTAIYFIGRAVRPARKTPAYPVLVYVSGCVWVKDIFRPPLKKKPPNEGGFEASYEWSGITRRVSFVLLTGSYEPPG
jgi:hypothetical protein